MATTGMLWTNGRNRATRPKELLKSFNLQELLAGEAWKRRWNSGFDQGHPSHFQKTPKNWGISSLLWKERIFTKHSESRATTIFDESGDNIPSSFNTHSFMIAEEYSTWKRRCLKCYQPKHLHSFLKRTTRDWEVLLTLRNMKNNFHTHQKKSKEARKEIN